MRQVQSGDIYPITLITIFPITINMRCAFRCTSTAAVGGTCNAFSFNPESKVMAMAVSMVMVMAKMMYMCCRFA